MGCESPKNDIEQIICDVQNAEQQALINAAILEAQSERAQLNNSLESTQSSIEKVRETVEYIGNDERLFIIEYFGLPADPDGFVAGVIDLQAGLNFIGDDLDGVVGPKTLKEIYLREYQYNYENLGSLQQWRLTIYNEIGRDYPDWSRPVGEQGYDRSTTLRVSDDKIPDIFNRQYYFGATEGMPIEGGFINSEILSLVPHVIPEYINKSGVNAFLRNVNGKFLICVYINGELSLASYTSPGNTLKYGDSAATPQLTRSVRRVENDTIGSLTTKMHYISGGDDSVRNTPNYDGSYYSDPMPFAVGIKIEEGIYTHAGFVNGNPRSHGCPRLPAHYARGMYEIFSIYREIHWDTFISRQIS